MKYFTNAVHLCLSHGHHEHLTFNPYLLTGWGWEGVGGGDIETLENYASI